ncbi:MAG: aminotransferase class I/II-fold pyridoxal phosphate-dependent enzyme [Clostridia bacterium]|nr:aminotransferase class I/II-fold pyridoxal phosphate-dependent enzyme [Clostridia bacterium]
MKRPIYEMLEAAAKAQSAHMPGHKGHAPFGAADLYRLDTTELPSTDDLYVPERGIAEAERLYAKAAGAGTTLLLHNGSTVGIHVMLQLWAREGDTVLLPRNAHLSAMNACIIGGLRPAWMQVTRRQDGYCYLQPEDVLQAIHQHPEAKTLLLTRPDYYGGCMPLKAIIAAAHEAGIRVVVDEAHGAHLPWMEGGIQSAGVYGADAWVQSVHKTLPGLTGSAVLHLKDPEDGGRALQLLRREQTSSPSFLLMMSMDDARAWMEAEGKTRLAATVAAANALRVRLQSTTYREAHALWQATGMQFDPTRLVIDAPEGGERLAQRLRMQGIEVEMHDPWRVVMILTCMDSPEEIRHIGEVLARLAEEPPVHCLIMEENAPLPQQAMTPRKAVMSETKRVPIRQAVQEIAAVSAGLYPPGIPLVCPGERITAETAEQLAKAAPQQRFGTEGDTILCVK